MYKRAIEEGLFPSIRKLAASVGAQVGNVSTAIQLASLPTEIIEAFPSPLNLQFRWGGALKEALDKDPEGVLKVAQELAAASPKLGAKDVLSRLIGSVTTDRRDPREPIVCKGKDIGYWNKDAKGHVSIEFKAGNLSPGQEKRLHDFVMKLFDRA
jgi:ParB family chromosome partitioning protein